VTVSSTLVDNTEIIAFPGLTLTPVSFGTASPDRVIAVLGFIIGGTPTAVTIGGYTGSFISVASGSDTIAIAWAMVPTGTTGDIVWTAAGAAGSIHWQAASIIGSSGIPEFDSDLVTGATTTINTLAGGGVVAFNANITGTVGWTNATSLGTYTGAAGWSVGCGNVDNTSEATGTSIISSQAFGATGSLSFSSLYASAAWVKA
jgi:hypothetical protein